MDAPFWPGRTRRRERRASVVGGTPLPHLGHRRDVCPSLTPWWLYGHVEGITGWSIGRRDGSSETTDEDDARHLYEALEKTILPLHADRPSGWGEVMRLTVALNASFFNAHRMLQEYVIHGHSTEPMHRSTRRSARPRPTGWRPGTRRSQTA